MTRTFSLLAVALTLAGCASAPVHYHTLSTAAAARADVQGAPFAIDVLPVGIPAQLDQQQLVVRQGVSSLVVQDGERWSGPYADEIRNALAAQLAARLSTQDVSGLGLGSVAGQPLLRIQVQVRRFDAWVGEKVSLEATWRLHFADVDARTRLVCTSRFEVAAPGGYPEVVQAQQLVLGRLAEEIAARARAWNGAQTACIKGI